MDDTPTPVNLAPPRVEAARPLLIAGLSARFTCETSSGIPALWQRFTPYIGHVPGQVGDAAYGVCCNSDGAGSFDYIAGVEVGDFADLPEAFARVRPPAQRYLVFPHAGHIATICATVDAIWNRWLPESGHEVADTPDFERYDERFDPATGGGEIEIWVPIRA